MLMKNKQSYRIVFDNLLLFDGPTIATTSQHTIKLAEPIELNSSTELKNNIVSHIGRINNDAILLYFYNKINGGTVDVPSYPMMDVPSSIINGIRTQLNSPYSNIVAKFKNKTVFTNYLKELETNTHNPYTVITEVNGEIIVPNNLVVFNSNIYLPAHITFPFIEHDGNYVLHVTHKNNVFTIYCTMVFKKEKYIG